MAVRFAKGSTTRIFFPKSFLQDPLHVSPVIHRWRCVILIVCSWFLGFLLTDVPNSDSESFNPSLWEEQRKQRAQVAFECDEDKDERETPTRVSFHCPLLPRVPFPFLFPVVLICLSHALSCSLYLARSFCSFTITHKHTHWINIYRFF